MAAGREDDQSKQCSAPGCRAGRKPALGDGEAAALSSPLLGRWSSCPGLGSSLCFPTGWATVQRRKESLQETSLSSGVNELDLVQMERPKASDF